MENLRENINFVLVEPVESGNIGSSARAMGSMGFPRLSIVNPPEEITDEAAWMAHNAIDVLTSTECFGSLKDALADAALVIGISRRKGKGRGMNISIEDAAEKIIEMARKHSVAVVFGREARGLYNDETEECAYLVSIPAGGEHPSLNLSHAVQIVAYELHKATINLKYEKPEEGKTTPAEPPSTYGEQEHLYGRVMEILKELNYTKRGDREVGKRIRVSLKNFLRRAGITSSETQMFEGICSRILAHLRKVQ